MHNLLSINLTLKISNPSKKTLIALSNLHQLNQKMVLNYPPDIYRLKFPIELKHGKTFVYGH